MWMPEQDVCHLLFFLPYYLKIGSLTNQKYATFIIHLSVSVCLSVCYLLGSQDPPAFHSPLLE